MKRAYICMALCLLILFPSLCGSAAPQQALKDVRIGFFAFDGYHMTDENGARSGYGYEVMQHLAGYTDWQYTYIGYDKSWSEMQNMLEAGEIDLLTSAQKTAEREERFAFSDISIGTSAAVLSVKAGNTAYAAEDYANWNGMRVGMLPENSRNADLAVFAAEQGFSYTPIYFQDTDKMLAALQSGDGIDAVLTSNLRSANGEWIVAKFALSPFYIMTRKDDAALMQEVNKALRQLDADEPDFRTRLMHKYYMASGNEELAFTGEERAFINDMQGTTLTALLAPDRAPYSMVHDGEPQGILYNIAQQVIEQTGLTIQFLPMESRAEYSRAAAQGEADICFDALYDYATAEAQGYRLTMPYLDASVSTIYQKGNPKRATVAVLRDGDIVREYDTILKNQYDSVTYYDTTEEVINAVLIGKQDVAFLYTATAEAAAQRDVTNRLVAENRYGQNVDFAIGVNVKTSHLLYTILNKALASISAEDVETITQRYIGSAKQGFSVLGYMYDHPLVVLSIVTGLFLFLILITMLVWLTRKRRREHLQLQEQTRRNALLSDALAAAESASVAKSQFLSRVSHEMRTPLNAVIGFLTLSKDAEAEEIREYLQNSEIAAKQLLTVINDVLDMSAIEAGKLKIAHAPFDLKDQLRAITSIYLPQAQQKGITYETKLCTPIDEWLIGDRLRLNQIINNLLGNAMKFTEKGQVCLSVSQMEAGNNRIVLRFEVSDTGCGISKEMQQRLFRPFEQETGETAQKYGGNGLGLSIVKNLVAMMNGTIRVDSTCGEGTTFTADLPFEKSRPEVSLQGIDGIEKLRVLAVDDEEAERKYISVVLNRIGVRHTCVEDGDAALRTLADATAANDAYNICLIDWKMPHMNGIEITERIRAQYGKNVVVIVVSAYEQNHADASAKAAGANMFIPKPLFQSSLLDLFMTLTGGRVAKREMVPTMQTFTNKRVLLAEDNAMNRMVAVGLVRKLGIACESAEDGQIATEMFLASAQGYYDAILMDIQMPRMDGFAATREIRTSAHPDGASVPIIALTANAFNEDIAKVLSAGMDAHVAKPIEPTALVAALAVVFDKKD